MTYYDKNLERLVLVEGDILTVEKVTHGTLDRKTDIVRCPTMPCVGPYGAVQFTHGRQIDSEWPFAFRICDTGSMRVRLHKVCHGQQKYCDVEVIDDQSSGTTQKG